ncbi:MAG: hypothetical protein LUQ30_03740 [Methanothrix sp.]|jgi:hypothetical protein|nr:hypothetical protein [Methanothrix sp.]OYV10018.1 MAG: hypothetical protein CG437_531 [Methanosaeta sp. NSP1]OYV12087.1 MAG: hypothetical protein CG440_1730 [Methanosaeta sp. NSM2]MDD1727405.1 hypothetical protein [Methanothrix sp.]MDD1730964.1 hypothetical protein [Methanothrix sp.]
MIRARLFFWGREAEAAARAVEPDNLPNMILESEAGQLSLRFSTEKIGTLLSTVDDLLMNLKIAEETLRVAEDR